MFYVIDLNSIYLTLGRSEIKNASVRVYRVFFNRLLHLSPQGRIKEKSCGHVCIRY